MDADFLKKCESLCDKNSDWHGRLLTQQWHVIVTCLHTYSVCRKKSRYELWFELSCNNDISILHTIRFWFLHRHQMSYWSLILPRVLTFRLTWILYDNNVSQDILLERRHYHSFLVFYTVIRCHSDHWYWSLIMWLSYIDYRATKFDVFQLQVWAFTITWLPTVRPAFYESAVITIITVIEEVLFREFLLLAALVPTQKNTDLSQKWTLFLINTATVMKLF